MKAKSLIHELQTMVDEAGDADIKVVIMLGGQPVNVLFDPKKFMRQWYFDSTGIKMNYIQITAD